VSSRVTLCGNELEREEPSSSLENDHEVNAVMSRLSPVVLGVALVLILVGTVLHRDSVLTEGFAVLIATPALGIVASVVTFMRQHDYRFVLVGLLVLLFIALSAFTGLHV